MQRTSSLSRLGSRLLPLALAGLAACGGTTEPRRDGPTPAPPTTTTTATPTVPPPPGSATSTPTPPASSLPPPSPPGSLDLAVPPTVRRIHIDHVFLGAVPGCSPVVRPVDYDRDSTLMTWPGCVPAADAGAASTAYSVVSRTLSGPEAAQLEAQLQALTYVDHPPSGGEDGGEYYLTTFDAAGGEVGVYSWQNINDAGYPTVAGLLGVATLLEGFGGVGF